MDIILRTTAALVLPRPALGAAATSARRIVKIPTPYQIIDPNGITTEFSVLLSEKPTGEEIRDLVVPLLLGGIPERVSVLWHYNGGTMRRLDMIVDEEFRRKQLVHNYIATVIYRNNAMTQHPDADPALLDEIWGTAILFSRRVVF